MELTELRQILPCYQNGFRKRKNTVLNLRQLQRIIYEAFEGKNKVLAVFLDVKKAYDCVDRKRLLEIIEYLGVKGKVLTWLKHFLGKRYNQAIFNNEMSSRREFSMGVPQGSPISPLLFNIYLSEMKRVFKDNVSQFADDMVLWVTGKDMRKMETKINNKLEKIREFLENRNLLLSPEKCVAVLFCKGPIPKDRPKVIIGGEEIRFENKAKYLGIVMDKGLTWKHHIELISKKNMRTIRRLKRIYTKYKLPQDVCINLYKSLIRPSIEYGAEVWGDTSACHLRKLESLEQRGLTAALGVNRLARRSVVNLESGVLPLKLRIKRKLIKAFQKNEEIKIMDWSDYRNRKKRKVTRYIDTKERCLKEIKRMGIDIKEIRFMTDKKLDKLMLDQWRLEVEATRKTGDNFIVPRCKLKYRYFTRNRTIQRVWHQARMGVVNTNAFLYKIKKADTNKCQYDDEWESFEHILFDCTGYRVERKDFPNGRNGSQIDELKVLLYEDRPPQEKRRIA